VPKKLDPFSHFDRTPIRDRQTHYYGKNQRRVRHTSCTGAPWCRLNRVVGGTVEQSAQLSRRNLYLRLMTELIALDIDRAVRRREKSSIERRGIRKVLGVVTTFATCLYIDHVVSQLLNPFARNKFSVILSSAGTTAADDTHPVSIT